MSGLDTIRPPRRTLGECFADLLEEGVAARVARLIFIIPCALLLAPVVWAADRWRRE